MFPNHNSNYPGHPDPCLVPPAPELSSTDYSDDSLSRWDIEIDETRLNPADLVPDVDGINPCGFTVPPDSDLGSTSWTGSGRDRLDVQDYQNSLSSLLINTDDDTKGLEHRLKISNSELDMWLNEPCLQNEQSMDARKGKKKDKGGRPVKPISYEELLKCKGQTLEAAAKVLDVSVSTLKRHRERLTGCKTWSEFRRSPSVSQRVRGKERMEDEDKDKVSIYVDYKGEKIPFHLSSTAKLGLLQKHIKECLKLKVGTYDIKYFDGKHDLSIRCTSNLEYCLGHAVGGAPIVLKVVERI